MTETTTTPDRTVLTNKILPQAAFTATIDYGASARSACSRRTYDRIMTDT
jgi:hypothetical protein